MTEYSKLKSPNQFEETYTIKTIWTGFSRFILYLPLQRFDWLLIMFVIVYSLIGIQNFNLRMATLHQDDGPILYAYAFKDPSLFEGDYVMGYPLSFIVPFRVITSILFLIPALLWQYLDVNPYVTTWLIALIQGFSIGISIYIFTVAMVRKRVVALLAVIFAYIAGPWGWNMANYGASSIWHFSPYPGLLVLAPIMLAFACLIHGRNGLVLLLLMSAGLIHPNLTLYACAIVALYWFWEGVQDRTPGLWYRLAGLIAVGVITVLPALVSITLLNNSDPLLPYDEVIIGMRHNGHLWPWGNEGRWNRSWSAVLKWLILAVLSWRWRAAFSNNVQRLWLATVVSVFLISLSHVIGGIWQIPMLLSLTGLRSLIWLALISLPLVMYYWYAHLRSGNWLEAVLSILCLALPLYAREYALFWPLIIGLLLVDTSQGYLSLWKFNLPTWGQYSLRLMALTVLIAWAVSFLVMPFGNGEASTPLFEALSQLTWGRSVIGYPPALPDRVTILITIAVLGLMFWGLGWLIRKNSIPMRYRNVLWFALIGLIIVLYGSRFLWTKWQEAVTQRASFDIYRLDVQLWAREHTPPSSLFVTPVDGWRTMSLRPQLEPFTYENYAYTVPRQTKEHRDRLLDFYGISAEEAKAFRGYGQGGVYRMEQERFRRFTENDFLRFATEFGATHLMLPKSAQSLPLDLLPLYENEGYIIYSLERYPYTFTHHQFYLETALADALLELDFSDLRIESQETLALAKTGQTVPFEGLVQMGQGPWADSPALKLDSTTRLAGPPEGIDPGQGSVSLWLQVTESGQTDVDLVRINTGDDLAITLQPNGQLRLRYNGVGLGTAPTTITDGAWHHVLFTWQDGTQRFYLDGSPVLSGTVPASTANTDQLAIHWPQEAAEAGGCGYLAEFITFNRPLTPAEIDALYRASQSARQAAVWYQDNPEAATAAWLALGWSYYDRQDYEQAFPVFERVIALDADNLVGYVGQELSQGLNSLALARYSEAVELLSRAIDSGTNLKVSRLVQAYTGLGTAYCQTGQTEACLKAYERAVNLAGWDILTDEEQKRLSQFLVTEARKDLLMEFSNIVTEGEETYLVTQTGQKATTKGKWQVADGPWPGSLALMVDETTWLTGPPSGIRLDQGSLSVWARLTDDSTTYAFLARARNKQNNLNIYRSSKSGQFRAKYNDVELGSTSVAITDEAWHHYLLTWQDGAQRLYIDGKLALSGTEPAPPVATADRFAIGWSDTSNTNPWIGFLAEFTTFNRALTPTESVALYKLGQFAQNR